MGYLVDTTGRLLLPTADEGAAFEALTAAMATRQGCFDPEDDQWPVSSLADLATYAATSVERDGEWLVLATDDQGDPKWSEQATAFYAELARWVTQGTVLITGEDGSQWRYTYADGGLTQSDVNGWDGSLEPFGSPDEEELPVEEPQRRGWFRRR
ncbi:hypothetical protein [Nocardioides renjunii]|uniref:hypothetical protein n=1 Tax=Nocardioides renjunii TaxID=3095075 RepID=UPI002AFEFAE4|nr:hypothetical protein [Nocardioides sp. S-34]WQQ23607.1 hypothetical protein SHK17_06370 [Nocardioides sp. S-34]